MTALLATGLLTGAAAVAAYRWGGNVELGILLVLPCLMVLGLGFRVALSLRSWPRSRLGLFADAMVVNHRGLELRADWDRLDLVTLAEPNEWTASTWPQVKLTDRLTVHVRGGRPFSLRPAKFGLDPVWLRDVTIRLRDDPQLRRRLPEFDSALDLATSRVAAGEQMRPVL